MKQMVVPHFATEAEEARWWDAHRSDVEAEIRRRVQRKPLTLDALLKKERPSQPVTLRIAKEDLQTARRLAAELGVGYQTYLKMLLRGALAKQGTKRVQRANERKVARRGA